MSHIIEYLLYWFLLSAIKLSFYIHAVNWIWIACVSLEARFCFYRATFFHKRASEELLNEEACGVESMNCKGYDLWANMEVHRKAINLKMREMKKFFSVELKENQFIFSGSFVMVINLDVRRKIFLCYKFSTFLGVNDESF